MCLEYKRELVSGQILHDINLKTPKYFEDMCKAKNFFLRGDMQDNERTSDILGGKYLWKTSDKGLLSKRQSGDLKTKHYLYTSPKKIYIWQISMWKDTQQSFF